MTIEEPIWWEYVILEDANGVGIIKGLSKDAPSDVIDSFREDMKAMKKNRKNKDRDFKV